MEAAISVERDRRKAVEGAILPDCVGCRRFEGGPQLPVAAGGAGAALGIIPAAANAEAGHGFRFDHDGVRRCTGLTFAAPAFAAGAAFAVDGLDQQVFATRQAAMLCVAGTTAPLSLSQPLRPLLTL